MGGSSRGGYCRGNRTRRGLVRVHAMEALNGGESGINVGGWLPVCLFVTDPLGEVLQGLALDT